MAVDSTEEQAPQEEAAPRAQKGSMRNIMVLAIVMALEAAIIIVVMMRPRAEDAIGGVGADGVSRIHSPEELMAPHIEVSNIITSIRVDAAGGRLHTLSTGIVIKLGKRVEGVPEPKLNVKWLETTYLPKVQKIVPAIKDTIIREVSSRTYGELLQLSVRQQILDDLKDYANDMLKSYGVEPRIVEIYWIMWHFN